jgi:putative transposase
MTVCAVGNNIRIMDEKHIRLPKIGDVRFVYHRPLPSESRITSVCVFREVDGRFFVSIHVEFDKAVPTRPLDFGNAVGLDYKSDGLYVSSDGVIGEACHIISGRLNGISSRSRKRLSRRNQGSKNHEKARIKAARVASRAADCRKDFLDKASHELAERYDIVSVEDIDMRSIKRSLKAREGDVRQRIRSLQEDARIQTGRQRQGLRESRPFLRVIPDMPLAGIRIR